MKLNFNDYKNLLKNEIDKSTLKNFRSQFDLIRDHFNLIESMLRMGLLTEEDIKNNESNDTNNPNASLKLNEYLFKKALFGGTVEINSNREIAIPEHVVREIGLENGDIVTFKNNRTDSRHITYVRKNENNELEENFVIFRHCLVRLDDPLLYCEDFYDDGIKLIKLDEIPFKFVIPTSVVEKFNISEGDFIDVGYEKGDPHNFKVVWKYPDEKYITPNKSSHYKDKVEAVPNDMFYGIDFQETKVLIIGCEPRKRYYQAAVEKCSGNFSFLNGHEQTNRINSGIDNADIVLILKDFLSHVTVKSAVSHCKEKGKPFTVVDGLGIKTIIFEARKLIVEKENIEV
ncbi:DUF2325 domain-containing protein [Bacillus infantis]|uniref:DUF2325 domain-containing protein n=1 Tax=Bacillus infantis TaxID=324767 RepID=UPI003CE80A7A